MLFRRNIEPSCSYCTHGTDIGQGEVACRNRGIMDADGFCCAFCYEPTKREPEYARSLNTAGIVEENLSI